MALLSGPPREGSALEVIFWIDENNQRKFVAIKPPDENKCEEMKLNRVLRSRVSKPPNRKVSFRSCDAYLTTGPSSAPLPSSRIPHIHNSTVERSSCRIPFSIWLLPRFIICSMLQLQTTRSPPTSRHLLSLGRTMWSCINNQATSSR